jgi:hypothetical protein
MSSFFLSNHGTLKKEKEKEKENYTLSSLI